MRNGDVRRPSGGRGRAASTFCNYLTRFCECEAKNRKMTKTRARVTWARPFSRNTCTARDVWPSGASSCACSCATARNHNIVFAPVASLGSSCKPALRSFALADFRRAARPSSQTWSAASEGTAFCEPLPTFERCCNLTLHARRTFADTPFHPPSSPCISD